MTKKLIQILIVLLFGISLIAASPLPGIGEDDDGGSRSYCVATAYNPVKWGDAVRGYGNVSCTSTMAYIRIVVQLKDRTTNPDRVDTEDIYCYNTDICSVAAYLNLVDYSGHEYKTFVSGYWSLYSSYDETNWIRVYY